MKHKLLFLGGLSIFFVSCYHEEIESYTANNQSLDINAAKLYINNEISSAENQILNNKKIVWDWDNIETVSEDVFIINSLNSKTKISYYQIEILNHNGFEAVLNMFTPVAGNKDQYRKVVFGLDGEIISVDRIDKKYPKNNERELTNLLNTKSYNEEDYLICLGTWCYDREVGLYMSQDDIVIKFTDNNLNTSNSLDIISFPTVSTWISNYYGSSSYYYSDVPTYYSGSSNYESGYSTAPGPYEQMRRLGKSTKMIAKLKDLKTKTTLDREYASFITKTSNRGDYSFSNYYIGEMDSASINMTLVKDDKKDGFMHSHYSGLLPIFSPADLQFLYIMMTNGNIRNHKDFSYILVTPQTSYTIKIDDYQQFQEFGALWLQDSKIEGFEHFYKNYVNPTKTNSENEIGFLDFMGRE
ncbi:hypothetical protein BH23BAC2_BH23BAC2_24720 [soil metagenome]